MTLRRALEQSRNILAVKAMLEVGPSQVVDYADGDVRVEPDEPAPSTTTPGGLRREEAVAFRRP